VAEAGEMTEREERLSEQRRALPDSPGVYLFSDAAGEVIYVGKARSLRKRVASHFSSPVTRGAVEMVAVADSIDFVAFDSEAEALLAEQRLIKRHQPRFNVRLRDDKSYPYIAISTDEEFPRVYFTREKHRRGRLYFGPYSNARRVRETLDVLGKVFQIRSCQGAEPGRRSGSPCLDFHINRCGAPCVGYVSAEEYREAVDGVVAFLSGRYREIEEEIEARMNAAAEDQEYERAALERNRLKAVRSLLERQRVASGSVGSLDAIAVAVDGAEANAQVFQVRDGVLADRQSFYLENAGELGVAEVATEFIAQYYAGRPGIPPQVIVQAEVEEPERLALGGALGERRGSAVEVRAAAARGGEELLAHRVVDDAVLHAAAHAAADGHAEVREAVQEVGGAVERVDDPLDGVAGAALARTGDRAALLAEEGVVGIGAADGGDDVRLGHLVDLADEVVAALARHLERVEAVEAADDEVRGAARGAHGDVE